MSPICGRRWVRRCRYYRKRLADFPHEAFLVPDPARVAEFREKLAEAARQEVGICWRSMMLGAKRAKYFSPIDGWAPVLKTPGVSFVNLQYGDCAAEIARAAEQHRRRHPSDRRPGPARRYRRRGRACRRRSIWSCPRPPPPRPRAASVGAEVWFLTAGRTWPQLGTDEYPWYAKTRVLSPEKFGDWASLMPDVSAKLAAFAR